MRPTDFCFPSLCRREPAPRLLPRSVRFYPALRRAGCFTAPCSLRLALCLVSMRVVLFPAPRRTTEPLTPPSPSEISRDVSPYFFGAAPPLSKDLDPLACDSRDGAAASWTRGAFHRQVPVPSTRAPLPAPSHDPCFPRSRGVAHRDPALATPSLATTALLALAIGARPPLARPRPRELVVRLEEDPAHASLGQATPDDFCNTTRCAGTPFEQPILARELREA